MRVLIFHLILLFPLFLLFFLILILSLFLLGRKDNITLLINIIRTDHLAHILIILILTIPLILLADIETEQFVSFLGFLRVGELEGQGALAAEVEVSFLLFLEKGEDLVCGVVVGLVWVWVLGLAFVFVGVDEDEESSARSANSLSNPISHIKQHHLTSLRPLPDPPTPTKLKHILIIIDIQLANNLQLILTRLDCAFYLFLEHELGFVEMGLLGGEG